MEHDRVTQGPVEIVDATGLLCPLPIVRTARALTHQPVGTIVELLADDPGIVDDLPAWCRAMGHELVGMSENAGAWTCRVRKGPAAAPPGPEQAAGTAGG